MSSGLKIAALYGVIPQQRGFCGPLGESTTQKLLDYISGKEIPEGEIKGILERFDAVYPYCKLIAASNSIENPFDEKVVKAYWIGNKLLERVSIEGLRQMIIEQFSRPGLLPREIAEIKAKDVPSGSIPHHSFHVLFFGSITGRVVLWGELLDLCRICWGEIREFDPFRKWIKVKYQPLITEKEYLLGDPKEKYIDWNKAWIPQPQVGQQVSFHWNQAVQVLTQEDIKNLDRYTKRTLGTINSAP